MLKNEAEELKKLIDSFVDCKDVDDLVIDEGARNLEISEEDANSLFRGEVPEAFTNGSVRAVRSGVTADKVFLQVGEERRWIPDLETLEKIGLTLGDVEDIPDEEMQNLREGFGLKPVSRW